MSGAAPSQGAVVVPAEPGTSSKDKPAAAGGVPKAEAEAEAPQVAFFGLFKYADTADRVMMIVGASAAFAGGAGMPGFSEIFGRMINDLTFGTRETVRDRMRDAALLMVYVGLIVFVLNGLQVLLWMLAAMRQTSRIRLRFFAAALRQDIGWHDEHKPGELTARMDGDTRVLQNGINDKFSNGVFQFGTFLFGFGFGFYRSWELTLVMLGTLPIIAGVGGMMSKVMTDMTEQSREGYARAGEIATEVLENIRTVQVFGQEEHEVGRFTAAAQPAEVAGIKRELASSASIGVTYMVMFSSYSVAFYFASYLIEWKRNDVGEITAVFFAVLIGSFGLGLVFPSVNALSEARGAAHKIFAIIDRVPPIDIDAAGLIPAHPLRHAITFRDVAFAYPTRKEQQLFRTLNLTITKGTTVAFSGASGCGKSSIIQMVQRFYDPDAGAVLVDGTDLRELDLHWWRDQIGIVSQEPNLFSGSIADNVRVGKADATMDEVRTACQRANIHDLILTLPQQYDTPVGSVGSQLSGGQKQRIAIARAIVKNPTLLILDEATSALDRKSEVEVQAALDRLMGGVDGERLTVLVIAHRLATIRNADAIHFVTYDEHSGSTIAETGTFDELMARDGHFAAMANRQGAAGGSAGTTPAATTPAVASPQSDDGAAQVAGRTDTAACSEAEGKHREPAYDAKAAAEAEVAHTQVPHRRILRMNKANCWAIIVGLVGSLISGGVYPVYSVVLSNMLNVLGQNAADPQALRDKVPLWAGLFVVVGVSSAVGWMMQTGYAVAGERLTTILRAKVFRAMLRQDQAFFDTPGRDAGSLAAVLSGDTEAVHQLWGPSIGFKIQMLCNVCTGLAIGFYYSWKLALVTVAGLPAMALSGAAQDMMLVGFGHTGGGENENTVKSEALSNVRTVAAFNLQGRQVAAYEQHLAGEGPKQVRNAIVMGLIFGFSQFTFYGVFALAFWYGGTLIASGELTFLDVMTCSMAVLMGAMGAGEAGSFASKLKDAEMGAKRVFSIIDRVPAIDPEGGGDAVIPATGAINLTDVDFEYPTRPDARILRGLSVAFGAHTSTGLMGTTGCGKSTIVQLLARFYDPTGGQVLVGGKPLTALDLKAWRKQISIVLQEPSLFSGTVLENIRYSRPQASDEEVHEAARLAGIHDDVLTWPEQYQTDVGYKGRALSGGQKQRVAIARGLLRKPKVLLLDEATSALDNATEAVVQRGLATACQRHPMTVVSVAHRLTTIQDADKIVVLDGGVIIEDGSHEQLMALDGEYKVRWELYQAGSR